MVKEETDMKIGFDLDSVLCTGNVTLLRVMDMFTEEERENVEPFYYESQKPLLNPELFVGEDDEYIIITGRSLRFKEVTEKWIKKFCPNYKKLYMGNLDPAYGMTREGVNNWGCKQAKIKAKIINNEKLDIYIEDNGEVVKHLRKLCPNTKIIHYGGGLY